MLGNIHIHHYTHEQRESRLPQLLKMLTIVWASVWSNAHQQLLARVRTTEEHSLLPQREKGTQRHSSEPQ
jgi:hypothetical protein